jgi:hypothetical protein
MKKNNKKAQALTLLELMEDIKESRLTDEDIEILNKLLHPKQRIKRPA